MRPVSPTLSLVPHLVITAVAVLVTAVPSPAADDAMPTREAFLGEVLDAKPTAATPKFVDVPGSYHIEKEDLIDGLTEEAKQRKLTLRAVTILGPLPGDPLWTSYVVASIQEGEEVRVNSLVMPHARITRKATGLITAERYEKWLEGILGAGGLQKGTPKAPGGEVKKGKLSPFNSHILLVTWSRDGKTREVHLGTVGEDKKVEVLFERYNAVLKELKKTYPEKDQ